MRVSDYVAEFLVEHGIRHVFMVTGGGAMFLNDSLGGHKSLHALYNHHEQACAMGALGLAKYTNTIGVLCVSTGCGGTNTLTGVLDSYQDNTPLLIISGQVKRSETSHLAPISLRQLGVQEVDIIKIVTPITKYAITITESTSIAYHLEKALYIATSGRPGPVWIDIPLDIQASMIDISALSHFNPQDISAMPLSIHDYLLSAHAKNASHTASHASLPIHLSSSAPNISQELDMALQHIASRLHTAKRPIILAGNGIRLSGCVKAFNDFITHSNIPMVSTFLAIDVVAHDSPYFIGRIGLKGDRAGNFALANADVVLALGSRLSVAATGFAYEAFAREAEVFVIDIDAVEHEKNTISITRVLELDLRIFFTHIMRCVQASSASSWLEQCNFWKSTWSVFLPRYAQEPLINKYSFIEALCKKAPSDAVFISDAGSAYYVASQALFLTKEQRYITSGAQADMGFSLPCAIGVAREAKGIVLAITGDGSLQMNIQELQTLKHYNLPIKLFVLNNEGYLSIRSTQEKFFNANYVGSDANSGISFPNLALIAQAYGLAFMRASHISELESILESVLADTTPMICEILCPKDQEIIPHITSKRHANGSMYSLPPEDMYPYLSREEFVSNMIITPLESSNE